MRSFLIAVALVLLLCGGTWAGDLYIGPAATGDESGSDVDNLCTLVYANANLDAGETGYMLAGTYSTNIAPSNNGSSGSYITYIQYQSEVVTIKNVTNAIYLNNSSYIKVDGINADGENIGNSANIQRWVYLDGGSYCIIQNCDFQKAVGWAGVKMELNTPHHNQLLNNTMQYCGNWDQDKGDLIELIGGHHNLIEGNTISYGGHNLIMLDAGPNNIVRNNDFSNPWERILEVRNQDGNGYQNLVENNTFRDVGPAIDSARPPGIKSAGEYSIIRRNLFYSNVGVGIRVVADANYMNGNDHKIYNNVFYNNDYYAIRLIYYENPDDTSSSRFKNNIFYKNYGSNPEISLAPEGAGFDDNKIINNNFMKTTAGGNVINIQDYGTNTVSWYETNHPTYVYDNVELDPGFIDADSADFNLQSDSAMIDAGGWLTAITSGTGSGTSFVVDDASYFMDGWDMIAGDEIQLEGKSTSVTVTDINYDTDTITVDESVSWSNGDGVALAYNGSAPDIGAYEYEGEEAAAAQVITTGIMGF